MAVVNGTVKRLVSQKGFGFVADQSGHGFRGPEWSRITRTRAPTASCGYHASIWIQIGRGREIDNVRLFQTRQPHTQAFALRCGTECRKAAKQAA